MTQNTVTRAGGAEPRRVMLYSHDTFGLGHLRRSRAIANALIENVPAASAIILTGSPVAGRFTFPQGVDHVRLPGVTKLTDGSYASQTLGLNLDQTTSLRSGLILSAIEQFRPDILIVDKEPTGFRGELLPALEKITAQGETQLVLGLRDVLDAPTVLREEWERKNAIEALEKYYHEVWVYGQRSFYDPTYGLDLPPHVQARMHWTGFLRRTQTETGDVPDEPYVLITPGGGGDGETMVDLVLAAYERDPGLMPMALIVYGPFLSGETRERFENRVAALDGRVQAVGFDSRIENLFVKAQGVVCMGGYNTFCELLSFDKRAVIIPRTFPRQEQYIRARRGEELGIVKMLDERRDGLTPEAMIAAIRGLRDQPRPSEMMPAGFLDGLPYVTLRVRALLGDAVEDAAE